MSVWGGIAQRAEASVSTDNQRGLVCPLVKGVLRGALAMNPPTLWGCEPVATATCEHSTTPSGNHGEDLRLPAVRGGPGSGKPDGRLRAFGAALAVYVRMFGAAQSVLGRAAMAPPSSAKTANLPNKRSVRLRLA